MIGGRQCETEENSPRSRRRVLLAAENAAGESRKLAGEVGILQEQVLVFEVNGLNRRGTPHTSWVEVLQRFVFVFGGKQFLPFDAEGFEMRSVLWATFP